MEPKKYTLKDVKGGYVTLQADGNDQVCPFQMPIPVKSSFGTSMAPAACSSQCPHFNAHKSLLGNNTIVKLTCSGSVLDLPIESNAKKDLTIN